MTVYNPAMIALGILGFWGSVWSLPIIIRARRFGYRTLATIGWIAFAISVIMTLVLFVVGIFGR
ncbi:MAG: hypothetical protein IRY86_10890 [Thermorudis peleae]|jgi:hypothetical protein|nr:hypothetical protein [Thermorudis peleae]